MSFMNHDYDTNIIILSCDLCPRSEIKSVLGWKPFVGWVTSRAFFQKYCPNFDSSRSRTKYFDKNAQMSCFENDINITYTNLRKFPVLKTMPLLHTQIGANFLFWKWRHKRIPKNLQISCFENDATFAYPNQRNFPVLKMTPLMQTQIGVNFLFWKWRH